MNSERSFTIVCCSEIEDPSWRWVEANLADVGAHFEFAKCVPMNLIERRLRFLNLARIRGCFQAVWLAKRSRAAVLLTHGPTLAAWCAIFASVFAVKTKLFAHSFNFAQLPGRLKSPVFRLAFRRIDRFVVFSEAERALYARSFKLSKERFDFVHWGVRIPNHTPEAPSNKHGYVSAVGGTLGTTARYWRLPTNCLISPLYLWFARPVWRGWLSPLT